MQNSNKNYVIGIVLIILVVLAIIIFAGHKGSSVSTTATSTDTTSVNGSSDTSGNINTSVDTTGSTDTSVTATSTVGVQNPLPAKTTSINYTDSGFSPTSVTIMTGDTVTFVNQSSGFMWVAGNPNAQYPQSYPGFSEGAEASNGGKYSILFSQAGTYQYYNQEHVGSVGLVIVQNPAQ